MKSTKIIATLGPASDNEKTIHSLCTAGLDIARLNFSHGNYEYFSLLIEKIRSIQNDTGIMLDTKGPEIRTGDIDNQEIYLEEGVTILVTPTVLTGNSNKITINYDKLLELEIGTQILLDDGLLEFEVVKKFDDVLECRVLNGGILGSKKTVSIRNHNIDIEFLSQRDKEDILFGIEKKVDFIAASFVRTPHDVKLLREFLKENGGEHMFIISKIEHPQAVKHIDEIITLSDGIMIARGDLGVEVPLTEVPFIQESLIRKCNLKGKPVIVATQMLESMRINPRPTRAEISDVAQAILQGSDAIMLSGETASGKYPVKSVEMMSKLAAMYDPIVCQKAHIRNHHYFSNYNHSISTFITKSAYEASYHLDVKALLIPTESGFSARQVSKFRPSVPIFALAHSKEIVRQLKLSWGIHAILLEKNYCETKDLIQKSVVACYEKNLICEEDTIVITAGHILRESGHSNILEVFKTKHILEKISYKK